MTNHVSYSGFYCDKYEPSYDSSKMRYVVMTSKLYLLALIYLKVGKIKYWAMTSINLFHEICDHDFKTIPRIELFGLLQNRKCIEANISYSFFALFFNSCPYLDAS